MSQALKDLVESLPECYQPIFRSPDLSQSTSRHCIDRLAYIERIAASQRNVLKRPLRILDLGCAQGYFSLSLASKGDTVHGVDYLDKNIMVCEELGRLNPNLKVSFEISRIEDVINSIESDQYDLVLGLSVFHHLVHNYGIVPVQDLLAKLGKKVSIGIFECAVKEEGLFWADALPSNPRELLTGFELISQLAEFSTHLSEVKRPLYFASNNYFFIETNLVPIVSIKTNSHILEDGHHLNTRKYFLGKDHLFKQYLLEGERKQNNIIEYRNEVEFLSSPPKDFFVPKVFNAHINSNEAWLCRSILPGTLLIDLIKTGTEYNAAKIINDVLEQLISLEKNGLYHNDLRTWNTLVTPLGEAVLIDYGAISKNPTDCWWPNNIFLSFFVFVRDVSSNDISKISALPTPIDLDQFEERYRNLFLAFLQEPISNWSFQLIKTMLNNSSQISSLAGTELSKLLLSEINSLARIYKDKRDEANLIIEMRKTIEAQQKQLREKGATIEILISRIEDTEKILNYILNSFSWKVTAPLRAMFSKLKEVLRKKH